MPPLRQGLRDDPDVVGVCRICLGPVYRDEPLRRTCPECVAVARANARHGSRQAAACRHCRVRAGWKCRGLCAGCYRDPGIRGLYPPARDQRAGLARVELPPPRAEDEDEPAPGVPEDEPLWGPFEEGLLARRPLAARARVERWVRQLAG